MVETQREELIRALGNAVRIQNSEIPRQVGNQIIPIVDVSPKNNKRVTEVLYSNVRTASNGTLITTSADKKSFYITNIFLTLAKDAVCDVPNGTNFYVQATIDGANKRLYSTLMNTLQAENYSLSMNLMIPIKIDKNTSITNTIDQGYTTGSLVRNVTIWGYYEDEF